MRTHVGTGPVPRYPSGRANVIGAGDSPGQRHPGTRPNALLPTGAGTLHRLRWSLSITRGATLPGGRESVLLRAWTTGGRCSSASTRARRARSPGQLTALPRPYSSGSTLTPLQHSFPPRRSRHGLAAAKRTSTGLAKDPHVHPFKEKDSPSAAEGRWSSNLLARDVDALCCPSTGRAGGAGCLVRPAARPALHSRGAAAGAGRGLW
jgi:hypothetical protein